MPLDFRAERGMIGRVRAIQPASHHGKRPSLAGEVPAMCGSINPRANPH